MPYKIKKQGDKWVKINKETGKVVSYHTSKAKALASIRAYYANKNESRLIKLIKEQIKKNDNESDLEKQIDKIVIKNPKTGKKNKLRTALVNKENPNHNKAIQMLQDLKNKAKKAGADSNNPNIIFMNKAQEVLKKLEKPEIIQKKLNNTKTKEEFKKVFRKEIDPDKLIVDDKTLDLMHKAWKKNKDDNNKITKNSSNKKNKKPSHQKLNFLDDEDENDFNDYDYNDSKSYRNDRFENEEDEKNEVKKLNVKQTIGLLTVASMFGGIDKTFNFTSSFVRKYLERFREEFSNKSEQLKDLFNFNEH